MRYGFRRGGRFVCRLRTCRCFLCGGTVDGFELETELDRRIVERRHRLERYSDAFGYAAERQAHFEGLLGHREVPELMLQDDGHVLRILRPHAFGKPHAGRRGAEGDLEMMLAGKAILGDVGKHRAHDAAQGRLREDIVANVIEGHGGRYDERKTDSSLMIKAQTDSVLCRASSVLQKVEASVARCLRTPPDAAKTPGL